MAYFVVGKMKVEGVSKSTGNAYKGTNLFILESITSQYGEGSRFVVKRDHNGVQDKLYVPDSVLKYEDVVLNKKCEVSFDQYGNIKGIQF